jgi:hypothetical protein
MRRNYRNSDRVNREFKYTFVSIRGPENTASMRVLEKAGFLKGKLFEEFYERSTLKVRKVIYSVFTWSRQRIDRNKKFRSQLSAT